MLVSARAIAWPDPSTPSGGHLNRMIAELGIADQVKPKLISKSAIDGGAELVAKGDADVGLYLVSEVQTAKGIGLVGLLPPPLQSFVVYGAAIPSYNATPEAALAFIKFISDPREGRALESCRFRTDGTSLTVAPREPGSISSYPRILEMWAPEAGRERTPDPNSL